MWGSEIDAARLPGPIWPGPGDCSVKCLYRPDSVVEMVVVSTCDSHDPQGGEKCPAVTCERVPFGISILADRPRRGQRSTEDMLGKSRYIAVIDEALWRYTAEWRLSDCLVSIIFWVEICFGGLWSTPSLFPNSKSRLSYVHCFR